MKLKVVATLNTAALNRQAAFDRQAFIFDWVKKKWAEFKNWLQKKQEEKQKELLEAAQKIARNKEVRACVNEALRTVGYGSYGNKLLEKNEDKETFYLTKISEEYKEVIKKLNSKIKDTDGIKCLTAKDVNEAFEGKEKLRNVIQKLAEVEAFKEFKSDMLNRQVRTRSFNEDIIDVPVEEKDVPSVVKALQEVAHIPVENIEKLEEEATTGLVKSLCFNFLFSALAILYVAFINNTGGSADVTAVVTAVFGFVGAVFAYGAIRDFYHLFTDSWKNNKNRSFEKLNEKRENEKTQGDAIKLNDVPSK